MAERIVEKCPACGRLRNATDAQCPACGYDFTDAGTSVIAKLNHELDRIGFFSGHRDSNYDKKIRTLIENFHIPQVKREIFDLMLFIQPKALDNSSEYAPLWLRRQKEVIERAKLAFADSENKDIIGKIIEYDEELNRIQKKNNKLWKRLPTYAKVLIVIGILFLILLILPAKDISPEAYSVRFNEAIEKGKWDKAIKCLEKCPQMGDAISDPYLSLIDGLLEDDRVIEAANLYDDLSSYVSTTGANSHLPVTTSAIRNKFIQSGRIDDAQKYAKDPEGVTEILKAYITNGQDAAALTYYKSKTSILYKYDSSLRRRVFLCKDEEVLGFLKKNGIKID